MQRKPIDPGDISRHQRYILIQKTLKIIRAKREKERELRNSRRKSKLCSPRHDIHDENSLQAEADFRSKLVNTLKGFAVRCATLDSFQRTI